MTRMLRWGVLGCAGIATKAVIPAIQSSRLGRVEAIANMKAIDALFRSAASGRWEQP